MMSGAASRAVDDTRTNRTHDSGSLTYRTPSLSLFLTAQSNSAWSQVCFGVRRDSGKVVLVAESYFDSDAYSTVFLLT